MLYKFNSVKLEFTGCVIKTLEFSKGTGLLVLDNNDKIIGIQLDILHTSDLTIISEFP